MCVGPLAPDTPAPPPPPPVVPEAAKAPTPAITRNNIDAQRRKRAAGTSDRSTILTGARGVTDGAATAQKTLLGL